MIKKMMLMIFVTLVIAFALNTSDVKADTATANMMKPMLETMYRVDEANTILAQNRSILNACLKNGASAAEIATAQAAVNDATNLVNTLNTMISRDMILIGAAPAGVVNPPTFAVNSLTAQAAWNDYTTKAAAGHALIFPSYPKQPSVPLAVTPFVMY